MLTGCCDHSNMHDLERPAKAGRSHFFSLIDRSLKAAKIDLHGQYESLYSSTALDKFGVFGDDTG